MYLYTPYNIYTCIICVNMWNTCYEGYPMAGLGVVMASWWRCGTMDNMYSMHTHIYTWYMGCVAMYYVCITACNTVWHPAEHPETPEIRSNLGSADVSWGLGMADMVQMYLYMCKYSYIHRIIYTYRYIQHILWHVQHLVDPISRPRTPDPGVGHGGWDGW